MTEAAERPESKRYWALLLLGPPLRAIFVCVLFAGLHLGLGLSWPKLEIAGFAASLLEMLGILVVLIVVDHLAVGIVYRTVFFVSGWLRKGPDLDIFGFMVAAITMVPGFAIAALAARVFLSELLTEAGDSLFRIVIVLLVSIAPFVTALREAEDKWQGRANMAV